MNDGFNWNFVVLYDFGWTAFNRRRDKLPYHYDKISNTWSHEKYKVSAFCSVLFTKMTFHYRFLKTRVRSQVEVGTTVLIPSVDLLVLSATFFKHQLRTLSMIKSINLCVLCVSAYWSTFCTYAIPIYLHSLVLELNSNCGILFFHKKDDSFKSWIVYIKL